MISIAPNRPAPAMAADPSGLVSQLGQLAVDMTKLDAKLTEAQRAGSAPKTGFPESFRGLADRIDTARMGINELAPQHSDLVSRLGADAIDIAELAGSTRIMQSNGLTFGAGWDTQLDQPIRDVQEAAAALSQLAPGPVPAPGPGPAPAPGAPAYRNDVLKAVELLGQSISAIRTVPVDDKGSEATKEARIGAFRLNKSAQELIEPHFNGSDPAAVSALRTADASLEDAAWQLAKKPSPDGRFNGVDVPGALRDTEAALKTLQGLAGGEPRRTV